MRTRTIAALALSACLALAGCTDSSSPSNKPKAQTSKTSAPSTTPPGKLEPVWGPKLSAAAGGDDEATTACQQPSSNACARYVGDIMGVVRDLEVAIKDSGRPYPKTTEQIGKMTEAESDYTANGCQGDPTANDVDSPCYGVMAITVGTFTLDMTLLTDEVGL